MTSEQIPGLADLALGLQALREQSHALGLFADDRDLIECPQCGLQEDVAIDGRLITHDCAADDATDTGLRFAVVPNGRALCPRCKILVEVPVEEAGTLDAASRDHPIDPAVRNDIEARLLAIEAEHGMRVLYACESGSRGWGFASPDSDYDVRFIYVHPLPWYLQVSPARDVIELPISAVLDINGWELRKALALLMKGNATLIEWLDSPVVYRADAVFLRAMRQAARSTHRPERSFHYYLHMARKNYREYLRGETVRLKKYLYVLRPLLAVLWIEQGRGPVPMRFQALVDALVIAPPLRTAIGRLLDAKRAAMELESGPPLPAINAFIETELSRLEAASSPTSTDTDFSVLDRLLMDTVIRFDATPPSPSPC